MGLISTEVEVVLHSFTIKYYEDLGYEIPRVKDKNYRMVVPRKSKITVKVEDLNKGSTVNILVKCDCPDCENPYLTVRWANYIRYVREDGKYYCSKCVKYLYASEKARITRLNNGKSLKQWCIENNRQDVLERWDYELNDYKPSEISCGTEKKIYLKCPKGIHKSELKNIMGFTSGQEGAIECKQCNSYAQWGIDNIGEDFLDKYWDYDKNTFDPWEISYGSRSKKVWIICQNDINHPSYKVSPNDFRLHESRCPICNEPKGERKISKRLIDQNWVRINQEDFERLCNFNKYNKKYFTPQKTFDGLVGVGNGLLSYDFYLSKLNLLIEFQGEQHERFVKGIHKSKKDFEKQLEHDMRKRDYANKNNIRLLEIWYYDFNRIKEILQREIFDNEVVTIA